MKEVARAYATRILHEVYEDFMVEVLAIPVLAGRKTANERFPGAINSMTCEAIMAPRRGVPEPNAQISARTSNPTDTVSPSSMPSALRTSALTGTM